MISYNGDEIKIIDFGEGKRGSSLEIGEAVVQEGGYSHYRAPEICGLEGYELKNHTIDPRKVDVFALGILLCEFILFESSGLPDVHDREVHDGKVHDVRKKFSDYLLNLSNASPSSSQQG